MGEEEGTENLQKEMEELRSQNESLKGKMTELADTKDLLLAQTEELNKLKEQVAVSKVSGDNGEPASLGYIRKEMPELESALDYMIKKGVAQVVDEKLKPVTDKFTTFEQSTTKRTVAGYYSDLEQAVPDWEKINNDPEFKKFLNVKERYAGKTRLELLKEAHNSMDLSTVTNFFKDFTGLKSNNTNLIGLPNSGENFDANSIGDDDIIPQGFIDQFYQDKVKGRYKGKEADALKIEAKINRAVSSGKVS